MRGREVTAIRKAAVKWMILAVVGVGCSAPPAVVPSASPVTHRLQVVAGGTDGPVAGLRVCAVTLSGAQSCAPTGPDGIAGFALAPGADQVRSGAPAGPRRGGAVLR